MKKRNEIAEKYKIDTKDLFLNEQKFEQELFNVEKIMGDITNYQGHVLDSDTTLFDVLNFDVELSKRIERLFIYAHLHNDFDLSDQKANELYGKVVKLHQKYSTLSSYLIPEITSVDYQVIEKNINKNPKLKSFEINLKEIFRLKKHILSNDQEFIISELSNAFRLPEEIHSKLLDADLEFGYIKDEDRQKIKLTSSNYATYLESFNRNVRKQAFKTFYKSYKSVINTTATALAGEVRNNNTIARIRQYPSALDAALEVNNVNPVVYHTLIKSINNNLDIIYRQWDIRKRAMKIKELHIYDTYVPLVNTYEKKYTIEEAKSIILSALDILGEDYVNQLKVAFDDNWIDVYPTKNKRSGGYCTAAYLAHPYVLLNFDGRFDEVSTIAHELGHAMHYFYAIKNNSYQNYNYSIFVAEVASQVNELLLSYYMLDHAKTKEEKIFILDELIKRFKASVVRQTMFSEFELKIHELDQEKTILTKELFNDIYYDLNKKYYGPSVFIDDEIKYEWSRIPHFYYNFYVYQYSTGYIAALKLAGDIYHQVDGAIERYLKFLGLGCTKDPIESLKIAGIDLTDEENFTAGFKEFERILTEFEKMI